jgi:hypothetical protein
MGFKKGETWNGNKLGRPKGALNRSTEQAKLTIARVANHGLNNISEDLEKIRKENPIEAAKLYIRLLEYVVPKQKAIEMRAEIDQRIQQITVNINRSGSEETND